MVQHALGLGAERDLGGRGYFLALACSLLDLVPDVIVRQSGTTKQFSCHAVRVAQESKKDVLGFNRETAQLGRFVTGEEQRPSRRLGVTLEHLSLGLLGRVFS